MSQAGLAAVRSRGGWEPSTGAWKRSKFVDQASCRPASRAAKTSDLPSGVKVYSSVPPNGFDGESATMPRIRSGGSSAAATVAAGSPAPARDSTKRCERVPSSHTSQ